MKLFTRKILVFSLLSCLLVSVQAQVPKINSFTPTSGSIGAQITLSGSNFNTTAVNNSVYFGSVKANIVSATTTSLVVTVPTGANYGPLKVTNAANNLSCYSNAYFTPIFSPSVTTLTTSDFSSRSDFTVNTNPNATLAADVDDDGKLDIVVANAGSNNISVFLNTSSFGSISFATKVDFATGNSPLALFAADIDGDGKIDIITTNSTANTISVMRNTSVTGTASFAAKVDFSTATTPGSVSVADIDGDGKLDVAVANRGSASVSVFRNTSTTGVINFATKVDFSTATNPYSIATGDIDGDGNIDIAVANRNSASVSVLRNTSTTGVISFATKADFTTNSDPASVSIGDLDGDGKLDIVTQNWNPGNASALRNTSTTGSITFASKYDFWLNGSGYSMVLADFTGDGKVDAAATHTTTNAVGIFINNSTPGNLSLSGVTNLSTGTNPQTMCAADLDGDGKPDLIFPNYSNNSFSVYRSITTSIEPANALIFNGTNNYVDLGLNTITSKLNTNKITGEAWVNIKVASSFGTIMKNWGDNNHGAFHFGLSGTSGKLDIAITQTNGTVVSVTSPNVISLNTWHHVAFTADGINLNLYEDGVLVGSSAYDGTLSNAIPATFLGAKPNDAGTAPSSGSFSGYFNGSMDEIRIWNSALTLAQLRTNMYNSISSSSTGLVAYYSFNHGVAGGTNTGITSLVDKTTNTYNGTLKNFSLTGNTSNWVESYAMVVPIPTATTNITASGFTANWNAPTIGTLDNGYKLDVSTASDFSTSISGSPFSVSSTSQSVSGLLSNTTYYYRVKADKNSVTGQGGFHYSSPVSVTTLNAAVAITPGTVAPFCQGPSTTNLSYTNATNNPTNYSIVWNAAALTAGFINVTDSTLRPSIIFIQLPTSVNGTFSGTLTVRNSTTTSVNYPISITIYANPTVAAIAGPTSVCQTKTITLTNVTTGGIWSSSNNSIATINSTGVVTGLNGGNVVISYKVTNGNNCSTTSTYNVVVNAVPSRTKFVSDTLICKGTSVNINATVAATATYQWTSLGGFSSTSPNVSLTQDDSYKLTITLSNGCILKDSINIVNTSDPAIAAKMAITAQAFTNENVIAVNLTTPQPQTQNWIIPSGAQVVSQNANMLVLKFANKGSYQVGLNNTSYNVCSSKDSGKVVISTSDSILVSNTNIVIVREVAVSPNPSASGIFNLNIKLNRTGKVSIKVFSLFGLQVYSKIIPESAATTLTEKVDLSALPNDTYVAVIQTANANEIRKLLKN